MLALVTHVTEQALICLVNSNWSYLPIHAIDYKDRMLLPEHQCDQIILQSEVDKRY